MLTAILVVTGLFLAGAPAALPAEGAGTPDEGALNRYEDRLETLGQEVLTIQRDLEALLADARREDSSRVLLFLESPPSPYLAAGVSVTVDGMTVFSRPFAPAELDVLDRGLPLELVDLTLPPGRHRVALIERGAASPEPTELSAEPGRLNSWVARGSQGRIRWHVE